MIGSFLILFPSSVVTSLLTLRTGVVDVLEEVVVLLFSTSLTAALLPVHRKEMIQYSFYLITHVNQLS